MFRSPQHSPSLILPEPISLLFWRFHISRWCQVQLCHREKAEYFQSFGSPDEVHSVRQYQNIWYIHLYPSKEEEELYFFLFCWYLWARSILLRRTIGLSKHLLSLGLFEVPLKMFAYLWNQITLCIFSSESPWLFLRDCYSLDSECPQRHICLALFSRIELWGGSGI